MTRAANPHPSSPAPLSGPGGADLSATLLRLRAVGFDIARRRIYAVLHQKHAAPLSFFAPVAGLEGPQRSAWAHRARTVGCRTALVWIALAFAAGYGYWTETGSMSHNLASALSRAR